MTELVLSEIIFNSPVFSLEAALQIYQVQRQQNQLYAEWCQRQKCNISAPVDLCQIPFLPISFFKSHQVTCTPLIDPQFVFESSGTTGMTTSRHLVNDIHLYEKSCSLGFRRVYGSPSDWCILSLLPSYLERGSSSLVYMARHLSVESGHALNGSFLYNFKDLNDMLTKLEQAGQKTILLGVSFALLDFAAAFGRPLQHTTIMETGGMKGRKKEIVRAELHDLLKKAFKVPQIHSEYGMTELLSQAYAVSDGKFSCPPWMKVMVRDEDDPTVVSSSGRGLLNIVDLANIHSCSFIATDDVGIVYEDSSFEVLGRADNSDIRGCSLLAV
jgi:hypothetical protein